MASGIIRSGLIEEARNSPGRRLPGGPTPFADGVPSISCLRPYNQGNYRHWNQDHQSKHLGQCLADRNCSGTAHRQGLHCNWEVASNGKRRSPVGHHQSPPEHLLLASFNFVEGKEARQSIESLRDLIAHELESRLSPENQDKTLPSAETGELGFVPGYDRAFLTITLGLSASGVQKLGLPEPPADLRTIPWADLVDGEAPTDTGGDLVLQICADNLYICEHVVRRVEEELGEEFTLNTAFIGSQRYSSRAGRTSRREGRALIGFLDGTSNLDPGKNDGDAKLVFVDPDAVADYPQNPPVGELPTENPYGAQPADPKPHFPELNPVPTAESKWTEHGTYMTVRVSTFNTRDWDKLPQNDQEQTVGRYKVHGASLDLTDSDENLNETPAFASDKAAPGVAVNAHIRKANPRGGDEDEKRRFFRRGYPLIGPGVGELQRGLIFISFGRSITTQFEFVVRAWIRNNDFRSPGRESTPSSPKWGRKSLAVATTSSRRWSTRLSPGPGSCPRPSRRRPIANDTRAHLQRGAHAL